MLIKEIKFLLSHSAVYGIGTVLTQLVGLVMLPVYTRYLTPEDYGTLELITVTNSFVGIIVSVGVTSAIIRFYYNYDDIEYKNCVISTSAILYMISGIVVAAVLFNSLGHISYLTVGSNEYAGYFKIAFAYLLIGGFSEIGYAYLRVNKKPGIFVALNITRLISLLSLNIYFVVFAKAGVIGILYSTLITSTFFSFIIMTPILWRTGLRFSASLSRDILKLSLPLVPSNLLCVVINQSDRFFIRTLLCVADTGIYSLALKLGNGILMLVAYPFNMAFMQRRFEIIKKEDANVTFTMVFTYFSFLIFFFGLGLSIFTREILIIMASPTFFRAGALVPFVVFYCVVFSFRFHFDFGIFWSKKTYYEVYINIVIVIISLFLNYFFIRAFGLFGAVYAKCLTHTVHTILVYVVANRLYKIEYEFKRVFKAFALAILIYTLSILINTGHLIADVSIKLTMLMSYPVVLYLFSLLITREEAIKIRQAIANYKPVFLSATK